jgi:putative mRNA 3-end processing factor
MHIEVLGSGHEVGKSAILVDDNKTKIMLDYGVKLQPEPPTYPLKPKSIDAVILSHAHLDHSGALPILYKKWKQPCFMTDATFELASLLILDSMKVGKMQGYDTPFGKEDFRRMVKHTKLVGYNEKLRIGNFYCSLFDSGHIPGSAGILLDNNKRIFYTGDIQTMDSHLLHGCQLPDKADVLITESTYSYKDHLRRDKEEEKFLMSIEEILAKEEVALIPVFAVGRAQEILLILEKYASKIALDGMAKKASDIISYYGYYLRNPKKLKYVLRRVHWIRTDKDRVKALKNYPIIVSSAGMLGGGPAVNYLREIKSKAGSRVLFTGFLVEDSPGWKLIKTSVFENGEEKFDVHCNLQQFEMSAHTDKTGLFDIIKKTRPEKVICVHGESRNCENFAKDIEEKFNIQAFAPKNGEVIKI